MIEMTTISRQDVSQVVGYYSDAKDDYYSKDSNFTSWQGTGAEALGLEGEVQSERFRELLIGELDPFTKLKRYSTDASKERMAYDLTFSAPKGVSMQALIHGDKSIIEAHDKAVAAAIREAEKYAQARETKKQVTRTENTGNLVVATFRHETSRALDPDLHSHALVMNMTKRADGEWRALKNDQMMLNKMHLGDIYKETLALELTKAGYEIRYNHKSNTFDLAHFSEEQVKAFSSRSAQIEAELAKQGLTRETADSKTKSQIAMNSRNKKEDVSREEIHKGWKEKARDLGIDFDDRSWKGHGNEKHDGADISRNRVPDFTSPEVKADKAIRFAVKSLSERDASFEQKKLLAIANKQVLGHATREDVLSAYNRAVKSGAIIEGEARYKSALQKDGKPVTSDQLTRKEWGQVLKENGLAADRAKQKVSDGIKSGRLEKTSHRVTTVEGIRLERAILEIEARGRNTQTPIATVEQIHQQLQGKTLKEEQMRSVTDIVTTKDRFVAAHGFAGTGKSYMTMSAKEVLESHGMNVKALAPYGTQKKSLEEEGMPAQTVAAFLKAKDKKLDDKSVLVIDEAGVIPARQMKQLMDVIEKSGARAVFLGDTSQTKAVEAGKPFEQMIQAGMQTSYMKDIQRQRNEVLLEAVKYAAEGNTRDALRNLSTVHEVKDQGTRLDAVANRFMALPEKDRDNTLIISGTNESRTILNNSIRDQLGLKGQGEMFTLFERVDSTKVERLDSKHFQAGQIIIPEKDYKNGLQRGNAYIILDTGPGNKLTVAGADGEQIAFSPRTHAGLSVYEAKKTELAVGDKVMVTRNNKTLDVANGDRFTVSSVEGGNLTLKNAQGREIKMDNKDASYLSYAYATTVHKSQGLTCDKVLFNLDTRSLTTSKDVFYVGISRARHDVEIFTDDRKALGSSIARESPKTKATEIERFHGLEERYIPRGREYEPTDTEKSRQNHYQNSTSFEEPGMKNDKQNKEPDVGSDQANKALRAEFDNTTVIRGDNPYADYVQQAHHNEYEDHQYAHAETYAEYEKSAEKSQEKSKADDHGAEKQKDNGDYSL